MGHGECGMPLVCGRLSRFAQWRMYNRVSGRLTLLWRGEVVPDSLWRFFTVRLKKPNTLTNNQLKQILLYS